MSVAGRDGSQISLRLSTHLKERIHAAAEANNRSANAEITSALEEKYPAPIEPESLNKQLALAAQGVIDAWSAALSALGQDPKQNTQLTRLEDTLAKAVHGKRPTPKASEVHNWVRATRQSLRMTQAEFATSIGAAQSSISKWEAGSEKPGIEFIEKIVDLS